MSKKWKIVLTVLAAVLVLTLGIGAVAMADDEETTPVSNPLLARVAEILGKTEAELVDAIKTVRSEVAGDAITAALEKAVENGVITDIEKADIETWLSEQPDPADRDAMKAWWDDRPRIEKPLLYQRFLGARRHVLRFGWCHGFTGIADLQIMDRLAAELGVDKQALIDAFRQAGQEMRTGAFQKALKNAVTNGKLTQPEADEIELWWSQRPAALEKLAPDFGFGRMGRGFCGPRFFWNR